MVLTVCALLIHLRPVIPIAVYKASGLAPWAHLAREQTHVHIGTVRLDTDKPVRAVVKVTVVLVHVIVAMKLPVAAVRTVRVAKAVGRMERLHVARATRGWRT
jgi:hypothetical protein